MVINFCELLDVRCHRRNRTAIFPLSCNSDGLKMRRSVPIDRNDFFFNLAINQIFTFEEGNISRGRIVYSLLGGRKKKKKEGWRGRKENLFEPGRGSLLSSRRSAAPFRGVQRPFPRFQHNSISRFILQARCYLVRPPEFPRRPRIIRHLPSYNNGTTEGLAPTPPTPPPPPALAAMPEHWYWLIFPTVM